MKKQMLWLLALLVITQLVHAVNINDASCDQIVQCDANGAEWSGDYLACTSSAETTPLPEEVTVTFARIANHCEAGDGASDCIESEFNTRENLSDSSIYHGDGAGRFGTRTLCCDFGENTITAGGFVNDFNSNRLNPISREWVIIDGSDNEYDSCPVVTYDPQPPSSIAPLDIDAMTFLPRGDEFEQYSEPGFDQAVLWNYQDYLFQNEVDSRERYDEIKEDLQLETGVFSWDVFDIFTLANENEVQYYLEDAITQTGCTVYQIDCSDSLSTHQLCTANTGINIVNDTSQFFEVFFEKYKTPFLARSGHTWYYDNFGSARSFTGYYYWETLYGYEYPYFQTYQGSRQYTNQTIGRISGDLSIGGRTTGTYVLCDGYNTAQVSLSFDNSESYTNYTLGLDDQAHYELIKGEEYFWHGANSETDFVTSNPYIRWDWVNDGYDTDYEEIGTVTHQVDTSSATNTLTLKAETWSKGGTDDVLAGYKIYENPFISFDWEDLSGNDFEVNVDGSFNITPFGSSSYDYGVTDWVCYDFTNDGVYDAVARWNDSIIPGCSPVSGSSYNIYGNPKESSVNISFNGDYSPQTMSVLAGIHMKNRADYTIGSTTEYDFDPPDTYAGINLISSSWDTFVGDTISFTLSNSESNHTQINATLYDVDGDNDFDYCYSVDGEDYLGRECDFNSYPQTRVVQMKVSPPYIGSGSNTMKYAIVEKYGFASYGQVDYSFNAPVVSPQINQVYGDNDLETGDYIELDASGSYGENDLVSICWDLDGDGNDEKAFSTNCSNVYAHCDATIDSCFQSTTPETFQVDVQHSDYSNGVYDVILRTWDSEGYSSTDSLEYTIRDYVNAPSINLVFSDYGSHIADLTSSLIYNLQGSDSEGVEYACWDYTTDSNYDVCYSVNSGETHCGVSCTQVSNPLSANVLVNYAEVGAIGNFELTALVYNDDSTALTTQDYSIFLEELEYTAFAKISATSFDDDIDDNFIIDYKDYYNLSQEIFDNETYTFQLSSLFSTLPGDTLDFACWTTNLNQSSEWDSCYQIGGGYNPYCDMNCSNAYWWDYYYINNSNYLNDTTYTVSLFVGNASSGTGAMATQEFMFSPISGDEEKATKFYTLIASATALGVIILILLVLSVFGGLILAFGGFLFTRFRKKKQ